MDALRLTLETDLSRIDARQWDALAGDQPFLRHAFLLALHETGCASRQTGWAPHFMALWRDDVLAGAVPLYLKSHSRGEYVFDYAWADAFQRHGMRYYPKLLSAIPFTPVTGKRLLVPPGDDRTEYEALLLQAAIQVADRLGVSSLHITFLTRDEWLLAGKLGLLQRTDARRVALRAELGALDLEQAVAQPTHKTDIDIQRLVAALGPLSGRERQVLNETYSADRTAEEIARAIGTTATHVRVLRHRALAKMRAALEWEGA